MAVAQLACTRPMTTLEVSRFDSPDKRYAVVVMERSAHMSSQLRLDLIDIATGRVVELIAWGDARYANVVWQSATQVMVECAQSYDWTRVPVRKWGDVEVQYRVVDTRRK